ncbi:hypothetical protein JCM10449v2_002119 [Rhodotorula kratochvilovae]
MATIDALSAVVASLGATLTSLPAALTNVNTTLLSALLSTLASDLEPALPSLGAAQQEALLRNTTWLAAQSSQLSSFTSQLPATELRDLSHASLVSLIKIAATRYSIMTAYAPEIWSVLFLFAIAILTKVGLCTLLSPAAVRRAQGVMREQYGKDVDREWRGPSSKSPRVQLGHLMNLIIATIALVFQLLAYRLFALPIQPITFDDYVWFTLALKVVLLGYAADLLFGDVRPEIYLHHFFTFALLFIGQIAVYETKSPKFFRMAQYLIMQATCEQSTYAAMTLYHLITYFKLQDHRPALQDKLMRVSHKLLVFTKRITWVQKMGPAAFALYWLGRMWTEIDGMGWGRAWLGWSTTIIVLLLLLQVKFCDDVVGYKIHGGPVPSRVGPVMRILRRLASCACSKPRTARAVADTSATELSELEKGTAEPADEKQKDASGSWEFASNVDTRSRTNTLLESMPHLKRLSGNGEVSSSASSSRTLA